jgi:hypothetical protein
LATQKRHHPAHEADEKIVRVERQRLINFRSGFRLTPLGREPVRISHVRERVIWVDLYRSGETLLRLVPPPFKKQFGERP